MALIPKITEEEAEALQLERDTRRTKLFRKFCEEIGNLPDDFIAGGQLTQEKIEEHFEPLANKLYEYMKAEGMMVGDIDHVRQTFETVFGFTLTRITNFGMALIMNANRKHFGVPNIVEDLPMSQLEAHGLEIVDELEQP